MTSSTQTLVSKILPIIIGTAGHVDHGKTFLVRNLTNFDTDRHPEEKERGMSIDFAVAPYNTSSNQTVGIIDLPGHKDFIKNMTAGASSIDILLLIVAADDGIMPQTKEHLKIAKFLGCSLVIPVITKIDLVESSILPLVQEEINELINLENLPQTEFKFVSNISNTGISDLRNLLDYEINKFEQKKDVTKKAFRMFIRACFNQKGHGTIITGVPLTGSAANEDSLEILSAKNLSPIQTSIKSIQNYRTKTNLTESQISSALNIRSVEEKYLARGSVIATPDIFTQTKSILVWIDNDNDIKKNKIYTFHIGTVAEETTAYPLSKSESNLFNLRFKRPVVVAAGDKCILRSDSQISGGIVLSRNGFLARKSLRDLQIEYCIKAKDILSTENDCLISELLTTKQLILFDEDLASFSQTTKTILTTLDLKNNPRVCAYLKSIGKGIWINNAKSSLILKTVESIISRYHREKPYSPGIQLSHLLKLLRSNSKNILNFEESAIRAYFESFKIFKVLNGVLSLTSFTPPFTESESKIIERINKILEEKFYLATGSLEEEFKLEKKTVEKIIKYLNLIADIRKVENFLFKNSFIESVKESLILNFENGFTLQEFRELTSLSRNVAVALLDFYDGTGFSKRTGDKRLIISKN